MYYAYFKCLQLKTTVKVSLFPLIDELLINCLKLLLKLYLLSVSNSICHGVSQ